MVSKLRVILVDVAPKRGAAVEELLKVADCDVVAHHAQVAALLASPARVAADLVVVSVEQPDSTLLNQLVSIQSAEPTPLVLFADDEAPSSIQRAVQAGVSAYVTDGVNPLRMRSILEAAIARFRQFKALAEELHKTRCQLTERKLIERAKGIIMAQRGIAEDEAYKLMRKTAMDRNKRMVDIADSIIAASDLLSDANVVRNNSVMPAGVA